MSARNCELETHLYNTLMRKLYPDGLICINDEQNIFQKVKPYLDKPDFFTIWIDFVGVNHQQESEYHIIQFYIHSLI